MAMTEPWRLLADETESAGDPALQYALDAAIAEHVGRGLAPPTVRLWRPGRCLALGRFDVRLPRYEEAVEHLKARGIAVLRRSSGGQAVWQDERYLNFSVIAPTRSRRLGIPEAYKRYLEGFRLGLRLLGLEADLRRVAGAFCDGPYDLSVGDRKLVGTAQIQKRGVVIVHGTLPVAGGLEEMIRAVTEFYELAGRPVALRRESMATLAELLGREIPWGELIAALREGHRLALGELHEADLLPGERAQAREGSEALLL
jgi:lipoate-protein ligase A